MNRVAYLRAAISDPRRLREGQIIRGLIQCLSLREALELLDRGLMQPYSVRSALSQRLAQGQDQDSVGVRKALVKELTPLLGTLPSARRAACGSLILDLVERDGGPDVKSTLESFLKSKNGNLRKQALKRIRLDPTPSHMELLVSSIGESANLDVATTLLRIGEPGWIKDVFSQVESAVAIEGYWLGRLYLLFRAEPPADLDRLYAMDPTSWLYVSAKLGRSVEVDVIVAIYRQNLFSGRAGLVAWCAGQIHAWDALVEIERLKLDPPYELVNRLVHGLGGFVSDAETFRK